MTSPWSLGADRRYLEAVSNLPEAGSYDHEAQSNYLEADSNLNPNNYQAQGSNKNQSIFKLFIQTTFLIFHRSEIKSNEKFESSIWKWPFGNFLKSILYSHDNNYSSNHYYACIPNIFVYLMVVSIICISCFLIYNKKNVTKKMKFYIDFTFLIIGYVTSILPFMFIQHTFLYNYSIALIFGILFFANAIEKLINPKISVYIYLTAIILTLFGFFYFSPYVYGLSQPSCSYFF